MLKFVLLLLVFLAPFNATFGQEEKLPKVIEFSTNHLTIPEGSIISLELKAQGPDLSYRWERRGGTLICTQKNCKLNTSGWGAGEHKVFAVVYNSFGEALVPYKIKLLPRSFDLDPIELNPELESSTGKVRYFSYAQQSIRALKGEGYIFGLSEVNVIGSRKQLLHWNKRLVLPLSSLVLFGKEGSQEFLATGGSQISFYGSRRMKLLKLEKGVLRCRQLDEKIVHTTIKVGDDIQLQATIPADYLLTLNKQNGSDNNRLDLVVVKGSVEISYYQDVQSEEGTKKLVYKQLVTEGSSLTGILNERKSFRLSAVTPAEFEDSFLDTTPYYEVNFEEPLEKSPDSFGRVNNEVPENLDDAISNATSFLKNRDHFNVLEQLLPFNKQIYENYSLAYLLGKASKELFLHEQGRLALEISLKIDADRDEAKYELAHLNLLQENWGEAEDLFNETAVKNSENAKLWNYYRGFVNYMNESLSSSSWYFTRSLWERPDQEIDESTNSFLVAIDQTNKFFGTFEIFYLRDSNPLKLAQGSKNNSGIGVAWYDGYSGFLSIGYKIFQDNYNSSKLLLQANLSGHPDLGLSNYLDQTVSIPTVFSVINSKQENEPLLYLGLEPLSGVQMISNLRAHDKVGMKWKLGSFGLGLDLAFSYVDIMYLDPEPSILKPIDTINFGDNENLDIGYRSRGFMLSGKKEIGKLLVKLSLSLYDNHYRYQESSNKSFSSYSILIDGEYHISLRWSLMAHIEYEGRSYLNKETQRSDTLTRYGTSLIWSWLPTVDILVGIDSESKNSNLSQHSFQRWLYKAGLSYKL
ncbi:MAG: hypothetical protein AB8G05_12290 [Oligoflexales bacterium]